MPYIPTAITQAATNIGSTTARINGKISDDGGASCEARFRWRRKDAIISNNQENSDYATYGVNWKCQTFTPTTTFNLSAVMLGVKRLTNTEGPYLPVTVSLRATDVDGKPTGEDLRVYTENIPTGSWNMLCRFDTHYQVLADTKYAIVMRAPTGYYGEDYDYAAFVAWSYDILPNGALGQSPNSGGAWTLYDCDFYIFLYKGETTDWQNTLETNDTYYADLTGLDEGTEYEFQTQAKNSAGEGAWSECAYFETRQQPYERSGTALLGLVGVGSRPVVCVRSDTGLLGLLATATRSWALSREDTALLGLKATASRIITPIRAQTALLGLKATASQAVDYAAKTGTALLGLLATGSRTIALGRSKTALLGLLATRAMSTLGHYVKEAVVYLGLAVTGTRPIVLTRVDTALLGLKATAIRTISITRLGTALLGLKAVGDLIMPYIRTGTAYLGLKITASRSFALTRLDTALLGLKGIATRSLVLTRAKTALLGLKVIGILGAPGRALKLIIVTTQNRKLNVFTSLYRKIKVLTE